VIAEAITSSGHGQAGRALWTPVCPALSLRQNGSHSISWLSIILPSGARPEQGSGAQGTEHSLAQCHPRLGETGLSCLCYTTTNYSTRTTALQRTEPLQSTGGAFKVVILYLLHHNSDNYFSLLITAHFTTSVHRAGLRSLVFIQHPTFVFTQSRSPTSRTVSFCLGHLFCSQVRGESRLTGEADLIRNCNF